MGLDAGLAVGGATLDLRPPLWDGRLDLFWDWVCFGRGNFSFKTSCMGWERGLALGLVAQLRFWMGEWACSGTGRWTYFGWGNFRFNTSYRRLKSGLALGPDAALALGETTLD